jgi:tape measure domain-containing protein
MAVVAEELISDLIVRDGKLRSGIRSAQQAYGAGIGSMRNDTRRFESEFNRSSQNISTGFKQLAGTLAAGISLQATGRLIDSFTRLQNNLRVAGLEGRALLEVQENLLDISGRYGTSVEGLSGVFLKASMVQKDLGASTQQIIDLNEIVAASLKVTGTSAEQAQGALLQLGQALGSGVVRAEEFNSILEGALPLAQAAARGIDGMGGSVAKLRKAIADGDITSKQFFDGVLKGGVQTLADAEKATLTLSGAFEALSSRLTVYVGGAASANGVTGALSAGIKSLADNLETIIPALAIIAAAIGVRYVAALVASTAATVAQSVAATRAASVQTFLNGVMAESALIQGVYGSSVVRTTTALGTMATVARGAGASLLAAFGGPVTAAVLAVGAVIAGLSYAVRDTSASLDTLQGSVNEAKARLEDARKQAAAAGVDIKRMGDNADGATGSFSALNSVLWKSVDAMTAAANSAKNLALARIAVQNAEAQGTMAALGPRIRATDAAARRNRAGNAFFGQDVSGYQDLTAAQKAAIQDDRARYTLAKEILKANKESAELIKNTPNYAAPENAAASAAAAGKPKKTPKGRKGPDLAEQAAQRAYREEQELRSLQLEEIRAKEQLAATTEDRADLQREALLLERQQREAEIAEGVRRKELTIDQAKAQLEIVNSLYGTAAVLDEQGNIVVDAKQSLYGAAIAAEAARKAEEERASLSQTQADIKRDEMQFAYDMADTNSERRDIALQMIELDAREQRAKLEGIIAVEKIGSLRRQEAEALLAALDGRTANARDRAIRDTENPLERLARESNRTAAQVTEDIQSIQAKGLDALGDGITDVIMQTRSLGDVFKSVANQIIADLIRIAVQRAIIGPLANALFAGVGAVGSTSNIVAGESSKIDNIIYGKKNPFGRAGGGRANAGQLYRVNEGQREFFRPATDGQVIPLSAMTQAQAARPASSGSSGPTIVQLAVAPGEMFVPIVEGISGNVSVRTVQAAAPGLVRAATIETTRRAGRPRT